MARKTKIIATVGPSIHSKEAINEIIDAGANVLRLNFSHGSNDEYKQIVDWARSSNKKIAIMQDIQGPKIRTGHLEQSFDLSKGAEIEISNEDSKKNNENIVINYEQLFEDVSEGERILIDDGKLSLRVTKKEKNKVLADVEIGGELRSNQGVAFPDSNLSVSTLTKKDIEDLEFGNQLGVDFVAVSFVRNAEDIITVSYTHLTLPTICSV